MWNRHLVFGLAVAGVFSVSAQGALLAYEGFVDVDPAGSGEYSIGENLLSNSGGSGWDSTWANVGGGDYIHVAGGLSFGGLTTSGSTHPDRDSGNVQMQRSLDAGNVRTSGVVYVSVLIDAGGSGQGFVALKSDDGSSDAGSFGFRDGNVPFIADGWYTGGVDTGAAVADGVHLLVARFDIDNDEIKLYLNPNPTLSEPVSATLTLNRPVDEIGSAKMIIWGGDYGHDELRIGETWADVTPVPEPASLAFLGLGCLLILSRRESA